jgi:radical SAM-linked protein
MMSDSQQSACTPPPDAGTALVRHRARIRFRKSGDLRFVSHHDLMTCFERMLRRAALPFRSTQGFHPKPRLVFALSLALGIVGCEEVVELELGASVPPEEIHARLAREAPPGLDILSVRGVDPRCRAQVRSVTYRLPLGPCPPLEGLADAGMIPALPQRITAILASPDCWIDRLRPRQRRLDLRPYLRDLRLSDGALEIELWVTPTGGARPEEITGLLGLGDLLATGAFFERTRMEITDEIAG